MATDRRFFLALTVKNEAPNLWEWVAYLRAIGFTDIAIYQNDSVDGTQKMLRTMEKHGFIQYFNNPSHNKGWQNKAYRRASRLPEYHAADWAMALDCDEFLMVNTGDGTVGALVDALPPEVNACTLHWKAFGANHHAPVPEGLVTDEFALAEDLAAARRGPETRAEMERMNNKTRGRIALLHEEGLAANRAVFDRLMQDDYYRGIYEEIVAGFPTHDNAQLRTGTR